MRAVPLALAAGVVAGAASLPAKAASSLGPTHVGVSVEAPQAPAVGGDPPSSVAYAWSRCNRYEVLVRADGLTHLWPLGETGATAAGALAGEDERAAVFDGTTGAPLADVSGIDGTAPYTIEAWVRPALVDSTYRYIAFDETTSGPRDGTGIWLSSAGLGFERWSDGVKAGVTYSAGLPVGAWSLVTSSYDGAVMRLFVNGKLIGSRATTAPLAPDAGTLTLGAAFAGELDEVSLYPSAVARAHVAAHWSAGTTPPCTPIPGATGSTYVPVAADLGRELHVAVTSTNANGSATVDAEGSDPTDDGSGRLVDVALGGVTANTTVGGVVQVAAVPSGVPADRVQFEIDGVARYTKPAEAPYQYTWYTAAESNGTHTVSISLWGPGSPSPATASATVRVSNPAVAPTPLPLGKESMYALFDEGDAATANNLLDNVWPARGYPLPHLDWPLTWTEDPYDDAFWRFYFDGMQPLPTLLYEWKQTGDTRYLDKLIAILRSYVVYDGVRGVDTARLDNNHAAAYRTMALVNFYVKLENAGVLPDDLAHGLLDSLEKLGTFLAAPSHFEADYNHGFNEGAALLLLADNFPLLPGADSWRAVALQRLQQMLTNTIDADGVEVENSPFYHVYVLGLVYQIAQWAKQYEPSLAQPYAAAASKMLFYAAEITQPNGYLPMLGATATTYMPAQDPAVYGPMAAADPAFQWAYTRGAAGTPPPDGTVLFPVSGLYVMRSPLGSASNRFNQTYVTFNAGTYRTSHSDLDALGITMYSSGSTLLPTSGLFTYTQQPEFEYFHGTRSNDTVVVDGLDQAQGSAHAGSRGSSAGATWAVGTSDLYSGVHHKRTVVILRQGLTLVVDRLTSSTSHRYTQTWHLAPDASVDLSGGDAYVVDGGGKRTLSIRQADPACLTAAAIKGQTDPVLQGWYSSTYGFKQPAWALEFTRKGSDADFATLLAAGPYSAQTSTVVTSNVAAGEEVNVCIGGTVGYVVTLPTDPDTLVSISGGACPPPVVEPAAAPARARLPAPPLVLSGGDQAAFTPLPARPGAIPVLLFHSVCATSGCSSYNITPTELARTLLMIQRAGFHTISIADYVKWWHGLPVSLPSQPILLTFDDGRLDAYRGADAILEGVGDQATMFDVTGWSEQRTSKFLYFEELARMQESGRWEIELHAGQGHTTVQVGVDSSGAPILEPYYAWRRYDPVRYPAGDRLEPYADWQLRAEGDIAQAAAVLAAHVPGFTRDAFSVPFGDYGQFHTNAPRIPVELRSYFNAHFGVFFTQAQADPDFTTPGHDPHRYTIESTTTAADVYAWLAEHS
jgi:hypothetical protein